MRNVEFIEQIKIHIHDKRHLTDDMRMVQLKMHVTGDVARTISGLGSQGIIYATALKTLKDHFGQPSVITRAFISKITERKKIHPNHRQSLRDFSIDIINCLATLWQINYFADVNANDNLRKVIRSLPYGIIKKWKNVATDIRKKGEIPQIQHISNFIRKRVKAEFDPDFGDVYKSEVFKERKGIHSNQRVPGKNQSVLSVRANTELKRVQPWPIVPLRRESNTQWTTDCVSLALLEDIPLENADQRTNVARMAVLKCTIQFSMQTPRYQPRAEWSCICFG